MTLRRLLTPLTLSVSLSLVLVGCSGSDGAAGAAGAAGTPGKNALVRLETEPPGANCASGGTRVVAGVDTSGDGTLQAGEVTSTSYVCSGPQAAACTTLEGSITISNGFDWKMLIDSGCTGIAGDLVISAPEVVHLTGASPLQTIGGSLVVVDQVSLVELSLPSLAHVEQDILVTGSGLTALGFPALTSVTGRIGIGPSAALFTDPNPAISAISFPVLTTAGSIDVGGDNTLTSLLLPELAAVGGDLAVHDALLLPGLSLPKLTEVAGAIRLDRLPALLTASLPLLRLARGGLDVSYCGILPSLSLPALTTVEAHLQVMQNTLLTSISLPLLATVPGLLLVTGNDALPSLSLPQLLTVGGDLRLGFSPALGTVSMPLLGSIGGSLMVFDLSLPSLTLTLPALLTIGGDLSLYDNPGVITLSLPQLGSIAGGVDVHNNPVLASVGLPALTIVGLDLAVNNNLLLPQCSVDALVTRLVGAGWTGLASSSGNDATAACQ